MVKLDHAGIFSVLLNHTREGLIIDVYKYEEKDCDTLATLGFVTEDHREPN